MDHIYDRKKIKGRNKNNKTMLQLLGIKVAQAQALTTTTLGTSIDTVNSTWYDYFTVFITHAWPFILGGFILIGIIGLGFYLSRRMFRG